MRPLRIELEGFSTFREHTVVDFTDADLFAFVGPTGAGKSSVIDGMVFALYGSVPRLDAKLVHPVITQGKPEARVRLDFEVGGTCYTAVRVVRRTRNGASTKEARLERGDEVLAEDVRTMTPAVEALLGLDLDQFTKCVVLPQGAFAALLHETRKHRQELLVKLLDLGVYGEIGQAARRRVAAVDHRVAVIDEQVESLAGATAGAVDAASARIQALEAVSIAVVDADNRLTEQDDAVRAQHASVESLGRQRAALTAIRQPPGLDDARAAADAAETACRTAEQAELAATEALDLAQRRRHEAGDAAAVAVRLREADELVTVRDRISTGLAKIETQRAAVDAARAVVDAAVADVAAAAAALEDARVRNVAADLARHLHVGDDCPVCGNPVSALPPVDDDVLAGAEERQAAALDRRARADAEHDAARRALDQFEAKLAELADQETSLAARVGSVDRDELVARQDAIAAADEALVLAQQVERSARADSERARRQVASVRAAADESRRLLLQVRDPVGALGPPSLTDDIVADWVALDGWARSRSADVAEQLEAATAALVALEKERAELLASVADRAAGAGVTASDPRQLRDVVVAALAAARKDHERLVGDRERVDSLTAERAELVDRRAVYDVVARRMQPDSFQKWLLGEALATLVAGASDRLEELSSGRYGLALDDDEFAVVDHANADERRMARTLSGGETFLASLALALALAERVSELSPAARTSLDAIFLDEGFGTLDPETLDVVAAAIEELGANGRMVGIVSHVRDLAERVPIRFEVRRGPRTSTVERVEA